jgi:hypothetical protein
MFRTLTSRINTLTNTRRLYSSNKITKVPFDSDLGIDYPSSRFLPEKWIPENFIPKEEKKIPDIETDFTEDDKDLGLDFPSSRLNYEISTSLNYVDCLLCYSLICPYHQQTPCFPTS